MMKGILIVVCLAVVVGGVYAQTDEEKCNNLTSCSSCIRSSVTLNESSLNIDCYWCDKPSNSSDFKCRHFDFDSALPISGVGCPSARYNVGTCELDALTIIILIAVGCVLFVCCCCCFCICCCVLCAKRRKRVQMIEETRYSDERDAIRQRSTERRAERKTKHDEIRRKYGLYHDDQSEGTYKRLD